MGSPRIPRDVFFVDRSEGRGLQTQIRESLVSAVLGGRLTPGMRLPSSRGLAKHLNVSRITVTQAYQELASQGYLEAKPRSGFSIAAHAPIPRLHCEERPDIPGSVDWLQKMTRSLAGRPRIAKPPDWRSFPYPFIYGQMDMSLFHLGAWRDCARRAMGLKDFEEMATDAIAADDPMLVNYICSRTLPRRGIVAGPEQVLVTVGAQNALWLVVQLLMRDGRHAVCENPGYPDLLAALRWSGARVTTIDVDEQGLPVDHLPEDPDVVFVTPSHQAPTAVTMPMDRRQTLLAAAEARDFLVVEDDYEFEMSFLAPPSPALKSLDRQGRVIYIGSFSKALFPGLRLGYMVAPDPFIREAQHLRALMLRHPPGHLQRTAAYFLGLGHYDAQIRDMRRVFADRRRTLTRLVTEAGLEIIGAASFGGSNLWVRAPERIDSALLARDLQQDGVLIEPGAPFFADARGPSRHFRMAYSSIPADRMAEGLRRIEARLGRINPQRAPSPRSVPDPAAKGSRSAPEDAAL